MNVAQFNAALAAGPYAWPGGYPLYFVMADGEALSFKAAEAEADLIRQAIADGARDWMPVAIEVNWEDTELMCVHTNERIESAYSED